MKRISQREARQLRKRVEELEQRETDRRRTWGQAWFGGVEIGRDSWSSDAQIPSIIRTARKLGHAVVAVGDDSNTVRFVALPVPEVTP